MARPAMIASAPIRTISSTVALLVFLLAAAGAGVVAADRLQGIARRLLRAMVAMGAMHMAVIMLMVVIAVRTVDMGLLRHGTTPVCGRGELSRRCGRRARCGRRTGPP